MQLADPAEKGHWIDAGWNKIVYDPDGKRVLFYDRWYDKKHGGYTIYGNALFAFDPASATLTPIKIDNWKKIDTKSGGYRTVVLPENETEPTPVSRHVYHAFDYVPELKSVFVCNGANQTVVKNDKLVGHDEADGAWRLDLTTNKWTRPRRRQSAAEPSRRRDGVLPRHQVADLPWRATASSWILEAALAASGSEKGEGESAAAHVDGPNDLP